MPPAGWPLFCSGIARRVLARHHESARANATTGRRAMLGGKPAGHGRERIGIERDRVDPDRDQELSEVGIVARRLPADPDLAFLVVRALHERLDQELYPGVPLVEERRQQLRV